MLGVDEISERIKMIAAQMALLAVDFDQLVVALNRGDFAKRDAKEALRDANDGGLATVIELPKKD